LRSFGLRLVASRTLDLDQGVVRHLADRDAAEAVWAATWALAAPRSPGSGAMLAAVLLRGLIPRRVVEPRCAEVAVMAAVQLPAPHDRKVGNPSPPEQVRERGRAGQVGPDERAVWLERRLQPAAAPARAQAGAGARLWRGGGGTDPGTSASVLEGRMFERFTDQARRVVVVAQEEARRRNHHAIGTEHLLLALLSVDDGVTAQTLAALGTSPPAVRVRVDARIGQGHSPPNGHIPFTPQAKTALELSLREALQFGHTYIGIEHLLLALLSEGEGVAAQVLAGLGVSYAQAHEQVERWLSGGVEQPGPRPQPARSTAPADLLEDDEQLAQVRRQKEAAIDAGHFERAAALRDQERQLLADRARSQLGDVDVRAMVAVVEENQRLRRRVERLEGLLRQHGIDPDDGPAQTA
jgi:hypothetical protein